MLQGVLHYVAGTFTFIQPVVMICRTCVSYRIEVVIRHSNYVGRGRGCASKPCYPTSLPP